MEFCFVDRASLYNFVNKANLVHKFLSIFLCFVDLTFLYNFFQMKPIRCTLLLSIFISNSLHVSGSYVPIIKRTYCIYVTLVFFVLYGWLFGPDSHPQRVKNTSVEQIQYVLLIMGKQLPETCTEVAINILRSSVHLVCFI